MNIMIDGFGGDDAPREVLLGAAAAIRAYDIDITVTGDEAKLHACAKEHHISTARMTFVHAPQVVPMDADPAKAIKAYVDSSMMVGLQLLSDGKGDAFVSGGSTGALLMGATFLVKRSKGVKRPALGTVIPVGGGKYYMLIDMGANHDCRPEMLVQFAIMGSCYYSQVMENGRPRVALVNIGSEPHKGDDLRKQTYALLQEAQGIHFIGNIEPRDLPGGGCDVAVCDGFTGNIVLKLTEGFGSFFSRSLKDMLTASVGTKLAALLLRGQLRAFRQSLNYSEQGGAPLLGIRRPVIKAHGNSNAFAFQNAIRQAVFCCERDVPGQIERGVAALSPGKEPAQA